MKYISTIIFLAVLIFSLCSTKIYLSENNNSKFSCDCDTNQTLQIIRDSNFNKIPEYDTVKYTDDDFYKLDGKINKQLWYREIENPEPTQFTKYWDDYHGNSYHSNHLEFVEFYENKPDIELAFQLGPSGPLWAYHMFVFKKVDCCYLVTHTLFPHARITFKAYSILDENMVDSLFNILKPLNKLSVSEDVKFDFLGYFADNRNKTKYFIDFDKETKGGSEPKKEITDFLNFINETINWTRTY